MRRIYKTYLGLLLLGLVTGSTASMSRGDSFVPNDDQSRLPAIMAGCANASGAVRSGKGVMTVHQTISKPGGGTLESRTVFDVLFKADRYRYTAEGTLLGSDSRGSKWAYSWDGERVVRIQKDGLYDAFIGDVGTQSGRLAYSEYQGKVKLGRYAAFELDHWVHISDNMTARPPRLVGSDVIDGDACTVVEIAYDGKYDGGKTSMYTYWFWVDPAKGYTVRRIREWAQGLVHKERFLRSETNTSVRQYAGGPWGPDQVTADLMGTDPATNQPRVWAHTVTTFDAAYSINADVTDADLKLVIPVGKSVHDEVLDADYVVP
jgi:hypothetical protein